MPGELARSFKAHAAHAQKVEEAEAQHVAHRSDRQLDEDKEREDEETLHHREEIVMARLAEREEALLAEAQRLDDRTIKLHDGRRAYVDGDRYRDAEGKELTGADRAQAEVLHLEQPHAATWQEQQKLTKQWAETETLRRNIEAAQAGAPGTDETAAVSAAEKMLDRSKKIEALPDYGSGGIVATASALKP
jgi:hypothetical protein